MKSLGVLGFAVAVAACATTAGAATLYVGLTRSAPDYTTVQAAINAAGNGDTILIDPGTYMGSQGTMDIAGLQNITIQGNGGRPVLDMSDTISPSNGFYADDSSVHHKGLVDIEVNGTTVPSNITFKNIEWMHGGMRMADTPADGNNGACIRVDSCGGTITLRNCVLRDSQNGILDGNANGVSHNWDIQNCVFHDCGDTTSSGVTHNLYMQSGPNSVLTFKYNWSYNCHYGYCLKTRCPTNYIMYNRLGDEMGLPLTADPHTPANQVGDSIDVPDCGLTYVIGNVMQDVPTSQDGNILKYGDESNKNPNAQFYGVYNTILGRRSATVTAFNLQRNSAAPAYIANNFLVHDGTGQLVSGAIINNSAMVNSNLSLYEHQGMTPPAMRRYMYSANGYDGEDNAGTSNTYENWDVLNVRPVDPNAIPNLASHQHGITYQTLLGLALLPGTNPLALPATGTDGTSLLATGQFGSMPYVAGSMPASETRLNGSDIGAYGPGGISNHQPVGTITSTLPQYIYEGWTVNLTATASDQDAGQTLTYQWSQTAGQGQTLTTPTALNTSFTVAAKSLNSRANETLAFQFVATDNGSPAMASTPVTASLTCYMCGDIDHDNAVILADLKLLVASWNTTPTSGNWNQAADLDNSQSVNLGDLKLLVANWNRSL